MIRMILLRVLLASWFIPFIWSLIFIIAYLLVGWKDAINTCKDLTLVTWNGELK